MNSLFRRRGDTDVDPGTDPLLSLRDVSVELGSVTALTGASLRASPGTLVGLVGPNGAGKTTLLRTITGAVTPIAGTVHVAGRPVHGLSSRQVSRLVAAVPQTTQLAFDFPVRDVVAMGRTPYASRLQLTDGADPAHVDRAMERTEVTDLADRSIRAVSGGERQRVLLARALAQDTPVLLLDEPTGSLDINHQIQTFELVRELVSDGKTVVAAIHDLNLAARYCDELVVVADGETVAQGSPATVLTETTIEESFDTRVTVGRDSVTGNPHVTPLPDRSGSREGRIHVIPDPAGDDGVLYALWRAGYDLSVGPVPAESRVQDTAKALDCDPITVAPGRRDNRAGGLTFPAGVAHADVTVLTAAAINAELVDLTRVRAAAESVIVVIDPSHAADHTPEAVAEDPSAVPDDVTVVEPARVPAAVATVRDGDD